MNIAISFESIMAAKRMEFPLDCLCFVWLFCFLFASWVKSTGSHLSELLLMWHCSYLFFLQRAPFQPKNDPERNQWFYRDVETMAALSGCLAVQVDADAGLMILVCWTPLLSHIITQYHTVLHCITLYHTLSHSITHYHTVSHCITHYHTLSHSSCVSIH